MFTGLIKTQGEIRRLDQRGDLLATIAMREPFAIEIGDSIACNGICLTAVKVSDNEFKVSLSEETLRCSTAADWHVGTRLNLEPALRVGDALGGHFVSGHVDGVGRVIGIEKSGDSTIWTFAVPDNLARFIAPKGSIAVDGVSLTVNEVASGQWPVTSEEKERQEERHAGLRSAPREPLAAEVSGEAAKEARPPSSTIFTVNIIPHTAKMTGFGQLNMGDAVNLEIDLLARYMARLVEAA